MNTPQGLVNVAAMNVELNRPCEIVEQIVRGAYKTMTETKPSTVEPASHSPSIET